MSEPGIIKKLEEEVVNRIAAGEIIQRPANALKELVENSLDAGSTSITITVKSGGLKYLQIQDNGCGIRYDNLDIVCERFTTSKLQKFEDLKEINTYGFRGEALASISHIAHLTILTKTKQSQCAYKASYEDGKLKSAIKPCAGNNGTQITVEDLFYNVLTRKKALRSPSEEYTHILDVVGSYAIHNSNVGFTLKKYGENADLKTPIGSSVIENVRLIYGNTIARELIEMNSDDEKLKVKLHGFITNVNYSNKKAVLLLFINHRLVESSAIKKAIDSIYSVYLPKNALSFVYLSLEIDPHNVDVNVHPTKYEVQFLHEEQIIEKIKSMIENKLLGCSSTRVMYTQARLPGAPEVDETEIKLKDGTRINPSKLVRMDSASQKIDKFFPTASKYDTEPNVDNTKAYTHVNANISYIDPKESFKTRTFSYERIETKLTSVKQLRLEIENACNMNLREILANLIFIGCIDCQRSLIQYSTKLFLCNTTRLAEEYFYETLLYDFQNFGYIKQSNPLPLTELFTLALESECKWDPKNVELAKEMSDFLITKRDMINEYFSLEISMEGQLLALPILLDGHMPFMGVLPTYLVNLVNEVDWDNEKECFRTISRQTAKFYSIPNTDKNEEARKQEYWKQEHVLFPAIRKNFVPPSSFLTNGTILQIANLSDLYKVFERC